MRALIHVLAVCLMVSLATLLLAVLLFVLGGLLWGGYELVAYLEHDLQVTRIKLPIEIQQPLLAWTKPYINMGMLVDIAGLLLGLLVQRSHDFFNGLMYLLIISFSVMAEGLLAWARRGLSGAPERGLIFSAVKRDLSLPLIVSFMTVILNPTTVPASLFLSLGFTWFLVKLYLAIRFYKKTI